ncbi:MAG: phosphopantetheine-binding protein [Oscillospiraceae bacterium]|nr:phosphopantetheine-binding protein [Oscillospiraceae bacterium]MDD3833212.1 phosphopantetheine-binding protein [Oscillospiraceae bacterium]MDD4546012.1 phosphopantetheine-binding protein [Oscillospiraceae bacterium]
MVFEYLRSLLVEQYACEKEDVELTSSLDDLNLTDDDRADIAFNLTEHYGTEISDQQIAEFETVEDVVAGIEDQL